MVGIQTAYGANLNADEILRYLRLGFHDKYFHYGRICITLVVNQGAINFGCWLTGEKDTSLWLGGIK